MMSVERKTICAMRLRRSSLMVAIIRPHQFSSPRGSEKAARRGAVASLAME